MGTSFPSRARAAHTAVSPRGPDRHPDAGPRRRRGAAAHRRRGAILLVIERAERERYERAAMRCLAKLAAEADVDVAGIAAAAIALEALPQEPGARGQLAEVCRSAGHSDAAGVFLPVAI